MEQGIDVFENAPIPVPANTIEAVFLTHAHIDHSGMLPKLYKDGFRGSIYATSTTCNLCNIMLRDSAHIQESEAEWQNRKAQQAGDELVTPVYTMADAIGAISRFRPCEYGQVIQAEEGIVSGHDGFPVYVDSPLAVEATGIFLQCDQSCFDEETAAPVKQGINPIWFDDICPPVQLHRRIVHDRSLNSSAFSVPVISTTPWDSLAIPSFWEQRSIRVMTSR